MEEWEILDEDGYKTGKTMRKGNKLVWQNGIYHQGADVQKKLLYRKKSFLK